MKRRVQALTRLYDPSVSELVEAHRSSLVARDDIVDAMVATWTAERVLKMREERLPGEPVRDGRGLRMEIVI